MAYPVDEVELKRVFDEFDTDGSNEVSIEEIKKMAMSLGMVFEPDKLEKMIKEVDVNGNGEIDFQEFKEIMTKTMAGSGAIDGFSAIALRKKNNGPPMKWRTDKKGPGISVEGDSVTRPANAEGFGVQLLDLACASGGYDCASVLIECPAVSSNTFIGVVGSNFQGTPWNESFESSKLAVSVRADGHVFRKGVDLAPLIKLSPLHDGCFVTLQLHMHDQEMVISVLDASQHQKSSVTVDALPVEVCVAISLGAGDAAQRVKVVGSSSEKAEKTRVKKFGADTWDEENVQTLSVDGAGTTGSSVVETAAMMI